MSANRYFVRRGVATAVTIALCVGAVISGPVPRTSATAGVGQNNAACSTAANVASYAVLELIGVIPGLSQFWKVANALAKTARHGLCLDRGREVAVVEFLVAQMETTAGRIVDQRALRSVYARSADLMLTLQREQASLEQVERMTASERAALSALLQTIGNTASQLEAELGELPWQSLPAVGLIGGIKNGALTLAYGLADPGPRRQHLRNVVLPAEVEETRLFAVRSELLERFALEYLALRNELTLFRGSPFVLTNNRVVGTKRKCLDVSGSQPGQGSGLRLWDCDQVGVESGQEWRFVPGSGQVRNLRLGLCLDVAAGSEATSRLLLGECQRADISSREPDNEPGYGGQEWGMHPLGYLVHLASGRCLDLAGSQAVENGAVAQVAACEYGRSADVGARGSSSGLLANDPFTDQSWSMWFRGGRLPTVPAPLPPKELEDIPPPDSLPPSVSIISLEQRRGTTSVELEFGIDQTAASVECQVDDGAFCGVRVTLGGPGTWPPACTGSSSAPQTTTATPPGPRCRWQLTPSRR